MKTPNKEVSAETTSTALIDEAIESVKSAKTVKEPCTKALHLINAMDALDTLGSKNIEVKKFGNHEQSRVCRIDLTVAVAHKGEWAALKNLEKCLKTMNAKAERGTFIIHASGAFAAFGKL